MKTNLRRALALLAIVATTSSTLLIARGADETGAHPERMGGTLLYGRGSDSITLDPPKCDDGESVIVVENIFDSLVKYSDDGASIEPLLAEKWEHTPDGKQWTFHLAKGVKFHDGTPFNADSVVFTFERLLQEKHPFHDPEFVNAELFKPIVKITAKDPETVVFDLDRPLAPLLFLGNLTMYTVRIVSPEAVKKLGNKAFSEHPVGCGPFVFKQWERKQKIVLDANKDYFRGRPYLDRVILSSVEENAGRFEQLKAGKLHVIEGVTPTIAKDVESRKGELTLLRKTGMNVGYLAVNNDKPPFNDKRVRQAIRLALDPGRIVATNFQGMGTVAKNLFPPFIFAWDADAPDPKPDVEKAKALLKEAGVALPLKFELLHMANPRPYFPEPKQTALVIQDDLRKVGIEVTLTTMDWKQYIPKTRNGEFEACLLGWTGDTSDPDNFLFLLAAKDCINSTNVCRCADEEINKGCREAQSELDDTKRKQLYVNVQRRLREEAPLTPLVHADQLTATRANVKGLVLHPTGRRDFFPVYLER